MNSNKEPRPERKKEAIRLGVISSLGIQLVVSTVIGYGIGAWLDKKFHTVPTLTLVFLFLGIGAGFLNLFRVMNRS